MSRILKFFEDRHNIAAIDRPHFSGSDNAAAGFVIVFQVDDFQILADRFQYQKLILKLIHRHLNQLGQFDPAGMPPLDYGGSAESQVTAYRNADTGTQADCETLVVTVTQSDTAAPIGTVAFIDPHYAEHLLTFTSETKVFIKDLPAEAEKTGHADGTVLCDPAFEILARRRADQIRGHRLGEFVFPSETSHSGHYSDPSNSWRRLCQIAKLEDLRLHDLRRTLGSWAAERNYSLHTIADMLGHSSTAATHIYARIPSRRKREAVEDVAGAIAAAGGMLTDPVADARRQVLAAIRDDPQIVLLFLDQIKNTKKVCILRAYP